MLVLSKGCWCFTAVNCNKEFFMLGYCSVRSLHSRKKISLSNFLLTWWKWVEFLLRYLKSWHFKTAVFEAKKSRNVSILMNNACGRFLFAAQHPYQSRVTRIPYQSFCVTLQCHLLTHSNFMLYPLSQSSCLPVLYSQWNITAFSTAYKSPTFIECFFVSVCDAILSHSLLYFLFPYSDSVTLYQHLTVFLLPNRCQAHFNNTILDRIVLTKC